VCRDPAGAIDAAEAIAAVLTGTNMDFVGDSAVGFPVVEVPARHDILPVSAYHAETYDLSTDVLGTSAGLRGDPAVPLSIFTKKLASVVPELSMFAAWLMGLSEACSGFYGRRQHRDALA
jgi:hypothetical protein